MKKLGLFDEGGRLFCGSVCYIYEIRYIQYTRILAAINEPYILY